MIGLRFSMNEYLNDSLETNIVKLLKGRRKINIEIAKKLELIFNINARAWLYIQTKNDIKKFNQTNTYRVLNTL